MIRALFALSLLLFTLKAYGHGGGHVSSEEAIIEKFQIQFHQFLKSQDSSVVEANSVTPFIKVRGQKIYFNSHFYKMLSLSLKGVAREYTDLCEQCLVNQVKENVARRDFRHWMEDHINEAVEFYGAGLNINREYGKMAFVGYFAMEALEHALLGPLGVCPILNAIYFTSMDTFRQMGHVFKLSRQFGAWPVRSAYMSLKVGIMASLARRRLRRVGFEHPAMSGKQSRQKYYSEIHQSHIEMVRTPSRWSRLIGLFLQEKAPFEPVEHSLRFKDYKELSKKQRRRKWLSWKTWTQRSLSSRGLWPIAYGELVLAPHFDYDNIGPGKLGHLNDSLIYKDLDRIFDPEVSIRERYLTAFLVYEVFRVQRKWLDYFLHRDFEAKKLTKRQYLSHLKTISEVGLLQAEFGNFLATASLVRSSRRLKPAKERAYRAWKQFIIVSEVGAEWALGDGYEAQLGVERLAEVAEQISKDRVWLKPKWSLKKTIKSCAQWLTKN